MSAQVINFAPMVNRDKKLDMVMAYPLPTSDSPFNLTPLSIMYPGKMFEDQGMRVEYWDARFDPPGMLDDFIKDTKQIGVSCFTGYQCGHAADILMRAKEMNPGIVTNVGGHHARMCPEDVKAEPFVDVVWPERAYHEHSFPFSDGAQRLWKRGDMQYITSSGCPYACLRGDTLINTVYGDIPIRDLVGMRVPVYTYKDGSVFVSDAVEIAKTRENSELVRVYFDDGTHIDCTPDHGFLQFKWGNQSVDAREWRVNAEDLRAGAHVRAYKTETYTGRAYIAWGRRGRKQIRARMIMEYVLGRRLKRQEQVHHKDHNKLNDVPDNLEFHGSQKHHYEQHPEVAERMRRDNPARKMTDEWRAKIGKAVTGKRRTPEQRERYRLSKLGDKNPNYKPELHETNHVVVSVERLSERDDVYCMEVPATGWFFANNVLVKNCTFCALRSAWTPRDLTQMEYQIGALHDLTGFTEVSFSDPNIGFDRTRVDGKMQRVDRLDRIKGIGTILRKYGIKWDGNIRADYVTQELVDTMAWSGCFSIEHGCESGNDEFLKKVIRKGHGIDAIKEANRCFHGSGISVMNSWVRGMPRETHPQWLDTMNLIDWVMDVAPEARASVYRFTPYPGGPAYDDAVAGIGIDKFTPPKTMKEWGALKLMVDATYWVAGLCFRLDNTQKNFPGEDWALIEPYVLKARKLWAERRPEDFTQDDIAETERLIEWQVRKHNAQIAKQTA